MTEHLVTEERLEAAVRLRRYLMERQWDGRGLVGPDSGVRANYRAGRFLKSYMGVIPWRDSYYYLQAQGYWIIANWRLSELLGDESARSTALQAAVEVMDRQRPDGSWPYPNRAWSGRVATAEGSWAAIALLETFGHTQEARFLEAARRWQRFLEAHIGFAAVPGGVAVNYFAGAPRGAVPNNSAIAIRLLAALAAAGAEVDGERCARMVSFLRTVQRPNGELPYLLPDAEENGNRRDHFQCFQYAAFGCLDLLAYGEQTGDDDALIVASGLARFLITGIAADGHVFFDCQRGRRAVVYHAAAAAAALTRAWRRLDAPAGVAQRPYAWLLGRQRADGSFPFSAGDYGFLRDERAYPRNLAMILAHLLEPEPDKKP